MHKFRGWYHPAYFPQTTGLLKEKGEFWVGFVSDDGETTDGMIRIRLRVPAESSDSSMFASMSVHHDGIKVLRHLEEVGFLKMFEELKVSTFYDLVQCFAACDIPITYHGGDEYKEMTSRKIYDMLYAQPITQGES